MSSHGKDTAGSFVSYKNSIRIMKALSLNAITLGVRVSTGLLERHNAIHNKYLRIFTFVFFRLKQRTGTI